MANNKAAHSDNCLMCLLNVLNCLAAGNCADETGCMILAYGEHEVTVKTTKQPSVVKVSLDASGQQVCQGDVSMVGYSILPDGFVLYADIKANSCEVCWEVTF